MENRQKGLQKILECELGSDQVFFQPPPSVRMKYPAIRYRLSDIYDVRADNRLYYGKDMYELILIAKEPTEPIVHKLMEFPYSRFVRSYISNNLYHYVYNIYF